jgi:hypothetical protein
MNYIPLQKKVDMNYIPLQKNVDMNYIPLQKKVDMNYIPLQKKVDMNYIIFELYFSNCLWLLALFENKKKIIIGNCIFQI